MARTNAKSDSRLQLIESAARTSGSFSAAPGADTQSIDVEVATLLATHERSEALQLISERIRELTKADGVAIAWKCGENTVCSASAGTAPPVGVTLDPTTGISGTCLRTGHTAICSDALNDPRVDSSVGQYLRSIVAVPILSEIGATNGLIEVLAVAPNAFDAEMARLLERIADAITASDTKRAAPPPVVSFTTMEMVYSSAEPAQAPGLTPPETSGKWRPNERMRQVFGRVSAIPWHRLASDRRILVGVAIAAVLGVGALVLSVTPRATTPPKANQDAPAAQATVPVSPATEAQPTSEEVQSADQVPARTQSQGPAKATTAPQRESRNTRQETNSAEEPAITIPSSTAPPPKVSKRTDSPVEPPAIAMSALPINSQTVLSSIGKPSVSQVTMEDALSGGEVLQKVRPRYPEAAKMRKLTGRVMLALTVREDGRVRNVRVLDGHPVLASAAVDAVRGWRYRPFTMNGKPVEHNTTVIVNFTNQP